MGSKEINSKCNSESVPSGLLACPFCKGEGQILKSEIPVSNGAPKYDFTFEDVHQGNCKNCNSKSKKFQGENSFIKAVNSWNRKIG